MNIKRKPIKENHNLANSWKAAGEQHTENYQLFKKELKPIIKTIQHDGYNTLQSIADELTKRKITTRFGKTKWHPSQVRNYLDK